MTQQATQADIRPITTTQDMGPAAGTYGAQDTDRLISDKEVAHLISASRSWPWKLARDGKFPQPIKLSERCTRWRMSDVRAWMADPMAWQAANQGG